MAELLTTMTLTEVVVISLAILAGLKEGINLIEFFYDKIRKMFDKSYAKQNTQDKILDKLTKLEEHKDKHDDEHKEFLSQIRAIESNMSSRLDKQQKTLKLLTDSDKDDIKSWIVQQYHHFMNQGWIDDFSLDTIHRRYEHYKKEGGNSYIKELIERINELPTKPQQK